MLLARQFAQHFHGRRPVFRLAHHDAVEGDDGIGAEDPLARELLGDVAGLAEGLVLDVLLRIFLLR